MEYRINSTDGVFVETKFALPAGPTIVNEPGLNCISAVPKQAVAEDGWVYSGVVPIYPFVIPQTKNIKDDITTALQKDPYGANGKSATVYFDFLDVFGNTLSPDQTTAGDYGITQDMVPGYLDPVISVDQWINVVKYYDIDKDSSSGAPILTIYFGFDTSRYSNVDDNVALATRDLEFYRKVKWQLIQTDVQVIINATIGELKAPVKTPIDVLKSYVEDIMNYLEDFISHLRAGGLEVSKLSSKIMSVAPPVLKTKLDFEIDLERLNLEFIFALDVILEIERTSNIDQQFINEPSIRFAVATIPADLYKEGGGNSSGLDIFATALETALPVMKVAVGQAKPNAKQEHTVAEHMKKEAPQSIKDKEIWLMRYAGDTGEPGIQFNVDSESVYFSTKPLSTKLISRPNEKETSPVPLRAYKTGSYLADVLPENKVYAGIDIEVLARTFVMVMDDFLSAETGVKAWNIQHANGSVKVPDPRIAPFEVIEQAKKDVASAMAIYQLANILQDGCFDGLAKAQEVFKQQLLISLEKAYSINAVVQNKVSVTQGFRTPTANFYGQLVAAKSDIPPNAYNFTQVKVPLTLEEGGSELSTITTMFSIRPESNKGVDGQNVDLISEFEIGLNYNIINIEHNFGTPINDYIPSSWLSLAHPIICSSEGEAPLIDGPYTNSIKSISNSTIHGKTRRCCSVSRRY